MEGIAETKTDVAGREVFPDGTFIGADGKRKRLVKKKVVKKVLVKKKKATKEVSNGGAPQVDDDDDERGGATAPAQGDKKKMKKVVIVKRSKDGTETRKVVYRPVEEDLAEPEATNNENTGKKKKKVIKKKVIVVKKKKGAASGAVTGGSHAEPDQRESKEDEALDDDQDELGFLERRIGGGGDQELLEARLAAAFEKSNDSSGDRSKKAVKTGKKNPKNQKSEQDDGVDKHPIATDAAAIDGYKLDNRHEEKQDFEIDNDGDEEGEEEQDDEDEDYGDEDGYEEEEEQAARISSGNADGPGHIDQYFAKKNYTPKTRSRRNSASAEEKLLEEDLDGSPAFEETGGISDSESKQSSAEDEPRSQQAEEDAKETPMPEDWDGTQEDWVSFKYMEEFGAVQNQNLEMGIRIQQLRKLLYNPVPKDATLKCQIDRHYDNSGRVYYSFILPVERREGLRDRRVTLMIAKARSGMRLRPTYVISLEPTDFKLGSSERSERYFGKLQLALNSDVYGPRQYILFDDGYNPRKVEDGVDMPIGNARKQLASIMYSSSKRTAEDMRMTIAIPSENRSLSCSSAENLSESKVRDDTSSSKSSNEFLQDEKIDEDDEEEAFNEHGATLAQNHYFSVTERLAEGRDKIDDHPMLAAVDAKLVQIRNIPVGHKKRPAMSQESRFPVAPSVKNFEVSRHPVNADSTPDMGLVRVGKERFFVVVRHPFSPFEAFGTAISRFDSVSTYRSVISRKLSF